MRKLTLPSSFIAGLLVGFFEFPCTGGVYLAIIGLLAVNSSYLEGLFYLALYNLAFIAPLCLLLILSTLRKVENFSFTAWNRDGNRKLKLVSGVFFIVIGTLILYFNYL
jgi:cytochrome c biogenesis protein CcdA